MRITQSMIADRLVGTLQSQQSLISKLSEQAETGNKINRPSDDPTGVATDLRTRDTLGQIATHTAATSDATGWLSTADTALQNITDVIHRAHELTVTAANGTTSATNRQQIAAELSSLIDSVKDAANAKYNGQYIFAGQATGTAPYQQGATDTYQGNTGVIARQIGPNTSVQINATGDTLLGSGSGDGKLLDVLRTLQNNLGTNNAAGLQTDLANLDTQLDSVGGIRATLGSTQNRVDAATASLAAAKTTATSLLGNVESADMADTLMQLSTQQTAYQAALKSGATIIQTSLLNFLS